MSLPIVTVKIHYEQDVVLARQRARTIAELIGFDTNNQSRLATAVSEIARNAFVYAGGGEVRFIFEEHHRPQVFEIIVSDKGPGIERLDSILDGRYTSRTGMGLGIVGTRRLMDIFNVETKIGSGTIVTFGLIIPEKLPKITPERVAKIIDALVRKVPGDPFDEIRRQNQDLLQMLDEINRQKAVMEDLNKELTDTNRGMLALYAELDEKATNLRKANELKVRFLSNMSHEFRTPLNSMLALSQLLLSRSEGELTMEQEKQIVFIKKAAEDLSGLVNDLLDLAKIEAGKITVHVSDFLATDIESALRGMFKPIHLNPNVQIVFENFDALPPLKTDEGKISQILRNLVGNAIKFTERGEVRVSAVLHPDGSKLIFTVADTGIGISKDDQTKIFQEYGQVDSPIQRKLHGTGLGLPLSRKLAELLGGSLTVESEEGLGSKFKATIPLVFIQPEERHALEKNQGDILRFPVLVIEDDEETQRLYEAYLRGSGYQTLKAFTLREARKILESTNPVAIVLDILMPGENGWSFLVDLKSNTALRHIPVFITTVLEDREQALSLGAADFCTKPVDRAWLLKKLKVLAANRPMQKALLIDDEEVARYLMKGTLSGTKFKIFEANNGIDGLRLARQEKPDIIFLDLVMPEMTGFEVLIELRKYEETKDIPVMIVTSKVLDEDELALLQSKASAVVPKNVTSRDAVLDEIRGALANIAELGNIEKGA
jgi:signal transduction histidine kinase/CheY-like chemotaxis protein